MCQFVGAALVAARGSTNSTRCVGRAAGGHKGRPYEFEGCAAVITLILCPKRQIAGQCLQVWLPSKFRERGYDRPVAAEFQPIGLVRKR